MTQSNHDMKLLIIRADASVKMGTGHVMRCLALAQAYQDEGGKVIFVVVDLPASLETRLVNEGMSVVKIQCSVGSEEDAIATTTLARNHGAEWVVIDGYHFGSDYQHWLKRENLSVLMLDDYGHADFYEADLVLNQNISAKAEWYEKRSPQTRLLLGPKYVLLRREFCRFQNWKRNIPSIAYNLLVTLGGSDPDNVTSKLIGILDSLTLENLQVKVVAGGANPYLKELYKTLSQSRYTIRILTDVKDMSTQMAWADMAIIGGGSTCWEAALLGLPSLVTIMAGNQAKIAKELCSKGSAILLGNSRQAFGKEHIQKIEEVALSQEIRSSLNQSIRSLVDGKGGNRITQLISENLALYKDAESVLHYEHFTFRL